MAMPPPVEMLAGFSPIPTQMPARRGQVMGVVIVDGFTKVGAVRDW